VNESEAIAKSQQGSMAAFNELVARYQSMVFNTAYRLLGDPDAAADAAQEAFLSAFQNIKGFRGGSFKVWLLRITTNACYDELRRRQRRPTSSLETLLVAGEEATFPPREPQAPEELALRRETQAIIQQGLLTLPPEQRTVLILSDIQGLSYEEIAQIMKTSLGTVKSRLSRARAHLRDYLQAQELLPAVRRHT